MPEAEPRTVTTPRERRRSSRHRREPTPESQPRDEPADGPRRHARWSLRQQSAAAAAQGSQAPPQSSAGTPVAKSGQLKKKDECSPQKKKDECSPRRSRPEQRSPVRTVTTETLHFKEEAVTSTPRRRKHVSPRRRGVPTAQPWTSEEDPWDTDPPTPCASHSVASVSFGNITQPSSQDFHISWSSTGRPVAPDDRDAESSPERPVTPPRTVSTASVTVQTQLETVTFGTQTTPRPRQHNKRLGNHSAWTAEVQTQTTPPHTQTAAETQTAMVLQEEDTVLVIPRAVGFIRFGPDPQTPAPDDTQDPPE